MSIEKYVTKEIPPCFIWQTATDGTVPVQNSYLLAQKCLEEGVPFAHHVFSEGVHGMSVATEDWLERRGRQPYTQEQLRMLAEAILRRNFISRKREKNFLCKMELEEHSHRNGQQSRKKKSERL